MAHYEYRKIPKDEVVKFFLNLSIDMFKKDTDFYYLAAVNMAGIAEEIIGKKIEDSGRENAQSIEIRTYHSIRKILSLEPMTNKEVRDNLLNQAKNHTKHGPGDLVLDPKREAENILERAIKNYEIYYGDRTDEMEAFLDHIYVEKQKLTQEVSKVKLE